MIIIHAGMHKTGSSSIQDTFAKLDGDRVDIPPGCEIHCSSWFSALFTDLVRKRGISPEEIVDTRHRLLGQTLERRRTRQTTRPLLISSERMSQYDERIKKGLIAMAGYLREHSEEDVRVIAYVRPPRSFMSSMFQQRCKVGLPGNLTAPNAFWPRYRARFEEFDHIFGRENVTLKPFQRERLEGGDVVLDFAREIGVALDPGEVVPPANETMGLEAVALLYVYWQSGKRFDRSKGHHMLWRKHFVGCISGLGSRQFVPLDAHNAQPGMWQFIQPRPESSRRFALADTATDPVVEAHRADLDWMEARLGVPLSEPAVPEGEGIGSEAELIAVALAARPLLEDRIAQVIADLPAHEIPDCDLSVPDVPDADRPVYELARRLDFLRDLLKPPALEQGRRKKKPSRREQG